MKLLTKYFDLFDRIVLILLFISFANISLLNGQNFPGNNPKLLVNKIVVPKVIDLHMQKNHYRNFFVEFDTTNLEFPKDDNNNKLFPNGPYYSKVSDYKKLVGKEFIVLEVYESKPKVSFDHKEYALVLENNEIGVVYYRYDPRYEYLFELEVAGRIDFPIEYYCSKIKYIKDKFDNKETYSTPIEEGISFLKVIENKKENTYMSLRVNGSTLNVSERGLIILFDNGSRLSKPDVSIDVDVGASGSFVYSAFIPLNSVEKKLFMESRITDFRLYIYDREVKEESGIKIKSYLTCLSN